jgi:hypothetical protein
MSVLQPQPMRGARLLLAHCSAVVERESASTRLERKLGGELAGLLVHALSNAHAGRAQTGRRGSSSP